MAQLLVWLHLLETWLLEQISNFPAWMIVLTFVLVIVSFGVREWCDLTGRYYRIYKLTNIPILATGFGLLIAYLHLEFAPEGTTLGGGGRVLWFLHEAAFINFNRGAIEVLIRLIGKSLRRWTEPVAYWINRHVSKSG